MSSFNEVSWGTETTNYPPELMKNIRPDDEVVAFINIVEKKGCLSKKAKKTGNRDYVAITHERIVGTVERVCEEGSFLKKSKSTTVYTFNIPLVKITSLETSGESSSGGCLNKKSSPSYFFTINAQGSITKFYTGMDSTVNDQLIRSFLEVSDYF